MSKPIVFEPLEAIDWRGQTYGIGDLILYPRQSGSSLEMVEAIVLRIWKAKHPYQKDKLELRVQVRPTGKGSRGFHRQDSRTVYLAEDGQATSFEKAAQDFDRPYKSQEFDREKRTWMEVTRYPKRSVNVPIPIRSVTLQVPENVTLLRRHSS